MWLIVLLALACAGPRPSLDPMEPINRLGYRLDGLGPRQISRGLETAADAALPEVVRRAGGRVFENLAMPRNLLSNLLQGRPRAAGTDLLRFVLDSSLGIGGLIDAGARAGLPRRDEDLGQVLCRWGVPFGPYVYFPVLGPSSASEATTVTLDLALAPADLLLPPLAVYSSRMRQLRAIREAHGRDAPDVDPYFYQRTAYRRDRLRQVRDLPSFEAPSAEEIARPVAYGSCGYDREPRP